MQIRFLLGPAGSGKTFLCLSEIRAALAASPDGPPLILLAPKQATFQLERQLLADDSLRGYTRLRILSFERLADFIFNQLHNAPPKMLDEEGRLMVLRALLARKRDELKLFRASARLTGFARQLSLVLRELQSNQLTPDALRQLAADTHDTGGLSSKLHDLALLLENYLAWLDTHGLQDVNCLLSAATKALKSPQSTVHSPQSGDSKMIGGLWLDGFAELSSQELALLAALMPHCEHSTLAFCLDPEAQTDSWLSHWASVQKTVEQCRKTLSAVPSVTISDKSLIRDPQKTRFSTPALAQLEQSWSQTEIAEHGTRNTEHAGLHLVTCTDPDAEAVFAAREILKFIRTPRTDKAQNRFRDAAVLVRDLEKYHEPLQRVFSRYGIPFFLDRRESVAHHPLAELTRSTLRTIVFQWPHDDWFAALKTGLVPVEELEIDRLENEALARGWKGAIWQEPIYVENQPPLSGQLEAIRKKIIPPFRKLAAQLMTHQNRPTGPQLATALRGLWEDLRVEEQLQQWAEQTPSTAFTAPSSVHSTVWTQMESWLENISLAFDDEPLALRDWLPVLEAGLANLTVGVIPPAIDQVLIGAIDRSRNPELKRAYVLGMNEGVFPATPSVPTLLTDADREALSRRGANLGPGLRERMAQERYFGYIACTRSSEQLAVTCARQDARGVALNPSLFLAQLQRMFPRAKMEEFSAEPNWKEIEHVFEILPALLRGEVVDSGELRSLPAAVPVFAQWERWHSLASPEKLVLSPAAASALYGRELRSSISALEMFAECPFEYFVRYGLRADERALFEADPRQTGSFQHEILSHFHAQLRDDKKRWRDITPQNARNRIAAIGLDLSRTFGEGLFEADERSRFTARTLVEQLQSLMAALVGWMRQYEFDPVEVELSFGLGPKELPAWRLPLGDGKYLVLRGKIDRVDLWRAPGDDEAFAVIVDYKSSGKKIDPIFLHHGMQLQLLAYLNALVHLPDPKKAFGVRKVLPVGVFYVPLRAKTDSGDSRYEVLDRAAASAIAAYQHTGRFDGKALLQLDNRGLDKGDQFKFAKKKDGDFHKRGEAMTTEAFGALLEKIENDLRSHGERIFAGDIAAKPYRKGNDRACDWCQFQAVCRFDSWIHPFNVLRKPPEESGTKKGRRMSTMTPSQQAALTARGNVLVVAGAGTGKTHTLIERCCALLLEEGCSLDEILMVTFTDAAAAEMRKRIRARLAEKAEQSTDARLVQRLEEQIALLDSAYISTLHSFCLRLVREHFHDERLRLDPEFAVLTEEQVHLLRNNTLDALLESHYGGDSDDARAFREFLTGQVSGNETKIRELIWQLHRYSRSLADPDGWFEKQLAMFAESEPRQWREWLKTGFLEWRERWNRDLQSYAGTPNVADCLKALAAVSASPSLEQIGEALRNIHEAFSAKWARGTVGTVRDKIEDFFTDAAFLRSLLPSEDGEDPLKQDWDWSRDHMQTLLRLTREFGESFDDAKREMGGVDFADLEQFALRLLWDSRANDPTALAREWQTRFKFVFVDEYQDINEAQDAILRAVSRDGEHANRFLVGDVKQSIYRFRLADPKIFQAYKKLWSENQNVGQTIPLSHNFRSHEAVLDFVNSFFSLFMREHVGGVAYDADAHLIFGAPDARERFSRKLSSSPQVDIHIRTKSKEDGALETGENGESESPASDIVDLDATEKEARLVALQLKKLRSEQFEIWDDDKEISRPVEWRDMVVLLRSPRNKAEIFAREFNRVGVPLHVKRESFYSATEISDLLSLLQLLDNPMQDLPLLAVLRSPLVGLSVDELAMIRASQQDDRFWTATLKFAATPPEFSGATGEIAAAAGPKLKTFLTSFEVWRRHARQGALSTCMRAILDETHYESLTLAQERGEERLANVNRLLRLMRQFDPYQRQGLLRFLRFVEAQRDAESEEEPASSATSDAVRLLSIHQSKGLEFPVVVVADIAKNFNLSDLRADILLDAEFGLCPRITPPNINARYPSLPYWLARQRQKRELLGEELRLLYVAMTRARERLFLVGSVSEKQFETRWRNGEESNSTAPVPARSYADWLAAWFAHNCAAAESDSGENEHCRWTLHDDASLVDETRGAENGAAKTIVRLTKTETERLRQKLSAKYPFDSAAREPAKTSVSVLRRRAMETFEQEEAVDFFRRRSRASKSPRVADVAASKKSSADIGTLYHRFLERVSFDKLSGVGELRAEAERMAAEGILSTDEVGLLNLSSLLKFWQSDFGKRIVANRQSVRRELAFTARFSPAELPAESNAAKEMENEFVVVQGVADMAVILPKEIWLLDFKTDHVTEDNLKVKTLMYQPQLNLYARALERIYRKPVTECWLHFLTRGVTVPVEMS